MVLAWRGLVARLVQNLDRPISSKRPARGASIRIGFVALTDCAPLVMAKELGLFTRYGLNVVLSREVGWATIRDKILYGELEAAHAPAGMVVAATSGFGSLATDCLTGMILNLHGNAITLSQRLWRAGVRDGHSLREYIARKQERLTFGTVYHWSSHTVLLRNWLIQYGIDPDCDVQLVIVPPSQVFANLRAKHLDGYCVGEPWNSAAVMAGSGFVVARSAELAPLHPEKVMMVRSAFATRAHADHVALIAALLEAGAYCDDPKNQEQIVSILAQPQYVNAPSEALRMCMRGRFDYGNGRIEDCPGSNIFSRDGANQPSEEKARWVIENFVRSKLVTGMDQFPADLINRCFRADIHAEAAALFRSRTTTNVTTAK